MRRLVVILLLVLTPLRSWAADSMATQMATQGWGDRTSTHAPTTSTAGPSIHCAGMADHPAQGPLVAPSLANADEATDSGGPCSNCAACQVCATVALVAPASANATSLQVHYLPWAKAPAFINAELVRGQKPPIS